MIEIIPPKVKIPKKKKGLRWTSFHRERKTVAHTTINGRGVVARLRKQIKYTTWKRKRRRKQKGRRP